MEPIEKLHPIISNIAREVDAIRGYLVDPVEGREEIITDEISHIYHLAGLALSIMKPAAEAKTEEITEEIEDIANGAEPEAGE